MRARYCICMARLGGGGTTVLAEAETEREVMAKLRSAIESGVRQQEQWPVHLVHVDLVVDLMPAEDENQMGLVAVQGYSQPELTWLKSLQVPVWILDRQRIRQAG